jgi:hypothetical protein
VTMRAAFIGFPQARMKRIIGVLERAGSPRLEVAAGVRSGEGVADQVCRPEIVFINAETGHRELAQTVEGVRLGNARMPVVLVYGAETTGKLFDLARRYDCWLFGENDHLGRGLTADEVAEAIAERLEASQVRSRLMQVSMSSGPCSTGD